MEFIEFLFPFQERLSYIGPEEFIQAFEKKDPLDNDKVFVMLRVSWVWSQTQETESSMLCVFNSTNAPQGAHNSDVPKHRE